mmetsp:Transcript_34301/g.110380  ORF Transcript_34301/g.110380 Transcript_34301/m.110380 type:complete len:251 (-) Transcript_34301:49-801(-)
MLDVRILRVTMPTPGTSRGGTQWKMSGSKTTVPSPDIHVPTLISSHHFLITTGFGFGLTPRPPNSAPSSTHCRTLRKPPPSAARLSRSFSSRSERTCGSSAATRACSRWFCGSSSATRTRSGATWITNTHCASCAAFTPTSPDQAHPAPAAAHALGRCGQSSSWPALSPRVVAAPQWSHAAGSRATIRSAKRLRFGCAREWRGSRHVGHSRVVRPRSHSAQTRWSAWHWWMCPSRTSRHTGHSRCSADSI